MLRVFSGFNLLLKDAFGDVINWGEVSEKGKRDQYSSSLLLVFPISDSYNFPVFLYTLLRQSCTIFLIKIYLKRDQDCLSRVYKDV